MEVTKQIRLWNLKYPLDRWIRRKYRIPYNSPQHRALDALAIRMEYEEDRLFEKLAKAAGEKEEYIPGTGAWFKKKPIVVDEKETKRLYEKMADTDELQYDNEGNLLL